MDDQKESDFLQNLNLSMIMQKKEIFPLLRPASFQHTINLEPSQSEKPIIMHLNILGHDQYFSMNFIGEISSPISAIIFPMYLAMHSIKNMIHLPGLQARHIFQHGVMQRQDFP